MAKPTTDGTARVRFHESQSEARAPALRGISPSRYDKLYLSMQISRLEGFYWVARTSGYAAAARAFPYPLTQPAVFQQVRKLEGELGVRLFERVGKAEVRLTAAGRELYEHAAP